MIAPKIYGGPNCQDNFFCFAKLHPSQSVKVRFPALTDGASPPTLDGSGRNHKPVVSTLTAGLCDWLCGRLLNHNFWFYWDWI